MILKTVREHARACRQGAMTRVRSLLPPPRIRDKVLQPEDRTLYVPPEESGRSRAAWIGNPSAPGSGGGLRSCLCTHEQLESDVFRSWCRRFRHDWSLNRRLWEWGFICQALSERGLLSPGKRGLGFAVGQEQLPALFASMGCEITATELEGNDPRAEGWLNSQYWFDVAASLNQKGICDPEQFQRLISFRPVDMTRIPDDLTGFDFAWSNSSIEHFGSIELGLEFLVQQMNCLKPGGVAVHTTEFNLTSNRQTLTSGGIVLFRRGDIENVVRRLIAAGHEVEPLDLSIGHHRHDRFVAKPPYHHPVHLRLQIDRYAVTSIALIIRKGGALAAR